MAQRFKTNMNKLRADTSSFETGGNGANFLKMSDGKHLIRILPPWKEDGLFYQKVGFHRPPGRDVSKKVICPDYTFGKKGTCPICKAKQRVYKQLGKDAAKEYAFQKRAYLNVLDMKKGDGQVYVFEAPATVMNPILNFMAEEDSDQLIDLNNGFNILVTRKKDGGFTKYEVMVKPGTFDLEAKGFDVDDILENLTNLDKFVSEPDPDDFQEILDALNEHTFGDADGGQDDGAAEDDDDPPPRKVKSQKVQQQVDEDEDDQDDPPPKQIKKKPAVVEEDEDDDVPPPPKKSKPAPAPVEDDDAEDEDDEPAPPPKKTLPGKKKPAPVEVDEDEDDAPAPVKKKAKPAPVEDDDLDSIEDFDDTGFDADEEIPF